MHRSPSPYQNPSSQPHPNPQMAQMLAQQYAAAGVAQVGPGSITYKTTYAPDGTPMYQAFKCVVSQIADDLILTLGQGSRCQVRSTDPEAWMSLNNPSYQTPNGIVSGIQWIPAEPTTVAPAQGGPSSVRPSLARYSQSDPPYQEYTPWSNSSSDW